MAFGYWLWPLLLSSYLSLISGTTHPDDVTALQALYQAFGSPLVLSTWTFNSDPCETQWTGVVCQSSRDRTVTRVIELYLGQMNLSTMQLPSELSLMSSLQTLDLSLNRGIQGSIPTSFGLLTNLITLNLQFCSISGNPPETLGNLTSLEFLQLTNNLLTGPIPSHWSQLKQLQWIEIADNFLSGPIPVSPGVNNLSSLQHFHAWNNSFTGPLPAEFSELPAIIHILVHGNQLSGPLPPEIGNIATLTVLSAANNSFNGSIPDSYSNMGSLTQLVLSNNSLTGGVPNLENDTSLSLLDLSFNSLGGELPSSLGNFSELVSLNLANCNLTGTIPDTISNIQTLETLYLSNNTLNGSIPLLLGFNSSLVYVDLSENLLTGPIPASLVIQEDITTRLHKNPLCNSSNPDSVPSPICASDETAVTTGIVHDSCTDKICSTGVPNPAITSGSSLCPCVDPFYVILALTATPFTYMSTEVIEEFQYYIAGSLGMAPNQVEAATISGISNSNNFLVTLGFYPSDLSTSLPLTQQLNISRSLSNHLITPSGLFGPFSVIGFSTELPTESGGGGSSFAVWKIVVIVVSSAAIILLAAALVLKFYGNRFSPGDTRSIFEKEIAGNFTEHFTLAEIKASTGDFNEENKLGEGGFGVVYKGVHVDGTQWAVKRAKDTLVESEALFQDEVRAISKLNHVNIVKLLGYCDDKPEHILVYELCSNGNLSQHLWRRKDGAPLTFKERVQIARESAEGLQYMHTFVTPGIIHRDVKSENIFLDKNLQAKVADFSLLKKLPVGGSELSQRSIHIAGTPGYMDPEYFRTLEVTAKSDVYSFGVVLLELITGKPPIFKCLESNESTSLASWATPYIKVGQLNVIVDPDLESLDYSTESLRNFAGLAAECVERLSMDRPDMTEVVSRLVSLHYGHERSKRQSLGSLESQEADRMHEPFLTELSSYSQDYSSNNPSFLTREFVFAPRD